MSLFFWGFFFHVSFEHQHETQPSGLKYWLKTLDSFAVVSSIPGTGSAEKLHGLVSVEK